MGKAIKVPQAYCVPFVSQQPSKNLKAAVEAALRF